MIWPANAEQATSTLLHNFGGCSLRQFVSDPPFDLARALHRRAFHHAVEMGGQRHLPSGLSARCSRLAKDIGRASNGTPISCNAMWTAIELAPVAKYRVSTVVGLPIGRAPDPCRNAGLTAEPDPVQSH
jgi:hypothetical protein